MFINVGGIFLVFFLFDDLLFGVCYLDNNFVIILNVYLREFLFINNISNIFVFINEFLYDLYLMDFYLSIILFVMLNVLNNRFEKSWVIDLFSWYINFFIVIVFFYGENIVFMWVFFMVDLLENMFIFNLIVSWDFIF